ncbi:MAG: GNAT family N-acetyltransferase [Dongiaceae bacterium]
MPIPTIRIRPAERGDHAFILGLSPRLAEVGRLTGRSAEEIQRFQDRYMHAALAIAAPDVATMIALAEDDQRLGFIHLETAPDPVTGEAAAYVAMLAVTAEAEGRGIASRLMAAAEDWARERRYRCISLDVFASNQHGRRFYARQGYHEDSVKLYKLLDRPSADD